jgi:Secretion system C-terminal sorting domain
MKKLLFTVIGIVLFSFVSGQTTSRDLVSTSGGHSENATYQIDWSVGEPATNTYSSGAYILSQGFQQSEYIIVEIEEFDANVNISVYPNPTTDIIFISTEEFLENSTIVLMDVSGRVVEIKEITESRSQIDMGNLMNGTYLLSIKAEDQTIKTLKIIKK